MFGALSELTVSIRLVLEVMVEIFISGNAVIHGQSLRQVITPGEMHRYYLLEEQ